MVICSTVRGKNGMGKCMTLGLHRMRKIKGEQRRRSGYCRKEVAGSIQRRRNECGEDSGLTEGKERKS